MTEEITAKTKGKEKSSGTGTGQKSEEIVHKYSSKGQGLLRETVFIAGIPYFIKKSFIENKQEDVITDEPCIEEATKKLRPPFVEECPYIPYEFKTLEEPTIYLQRAKRETIDTLYQKIKSYVALFNDVDEYTLNLLVADILISYFQDRCSTVHYLFVLGDNGTGKSVFGDTFECLGYRAVNITNSTESFWFRVFGTSEAGQVTIIAEEFDRIDEKSQVMGMLKEGYHPNAKVPRMNNELTKMDFFLPFGFKIMIAEKSPNEDKAKGLLDRSLMIKTYKGHPDYDIKEVRNPQGNADRQRLLDKLMDLRKLLLMFKLLHFKDPLAEVEVGLDGRDKELCKPLLQLFYGLGASMEILKEMEMTLKHFLDIKNNRREDSHEALLYPIIANAISDYGNEISTAHVWDLITHAIEGYFDKYVDKEGNEYIKNPNIYYISDYGTLNRNSTIKMIVDKFGAEMKHRKNGNVLIFDINHFVKIGKIYGETAGIQTSLALPTPSGKGDAGDAGDALFRGSPLISDSNSLVGDEPQARKSGGNEHNIAKNGVKEAYPLRKSESPESPESPIPASASEVASTNKVKCPQPNCDYWETPFYIKLHKVNAHREYNCPVCKSRKKKLFKTNDLDEYKKHWIELKHKGNPSE